MNAVGKIISFIVMAALLIGLIYGVWRIQRKINFSFSYKDQVRELIKKDIDPKFEKLNKRIEELEKRVDVLENG